MSKTASTKQPGPGRPQGSKNISDVVRVEPSRCVKCGSSKRSAYANSDYRDYAGAGLPYIGMWHRRCQCVDCGQWRVDREPVYEGKQAETIDAA